MICLSFDNGFIVMQWQEGDLIISDNAALGHEASPQTQAPPELVGLRVMHRTTIQGTEPPTKNYELDETGRRRC